MGQIRGCALSVLLLLLLAANGYTVWQIQMMRGEIASLRAEVARQRGDGKGTMLDYARDAAEAVGLGQIVRAEADLKRIGEMAQETKQLTEEQKREFLDRVEAAREAVAQGSKDAQRKIDEIARLLSRHRPKDDQYSR